LTDVCVPAVSVIMPEYTPDDKSCASTETVRFAGVVAFVGLTLSHEPPDTTALSGSVAPVLVTWIFLDTPAADESITHSNDVLVVPTVSVTGTIGAPAVAALGVMVMVP
jgi:hypothetical protein